MPSKDKEKRKEYNREYYNNRYHTDSIYNQKMKIRNNKNREKYAIRNKLIINDFKSNGCNLCPEKEFVCLVAHHLDPNEKDFNIGNAKGSYSALKLKAELAKCICLCANCHMKLHANIISLPDNIC
jgi:hypothetical protein